MESERDDTLNNETLKEKSNDCQFDPVADVEEILRKAGLEEEDSDAEFHSAEEDTDDSEKFVLDEPENPTEIFPSGRGEKIDIPEDYLPPKDNEEPLSEDGDTNRIEDEKVKEKEEKLAARRKEEDSLTTEEKEARRDKGQSLKGDGNTKFRDGDYDEAIETYSEALDICPLNFHKERAIMFANRAACKMKKEEYPSAIEDSTHAIELHPQYLKAILRRAELYEKTDKLDEALKDHEKVVELDPSQHSSRAACIKLAEQIKERNEKMKEEMMGKLKDLGNLVLRPFGLNVNNFNLQQDPNSGSYSVQFRQNPPGNGT